MKLSILIPVYNAQDYIGNCLKSLLNQDLSTSDYEILVMDDGSVDDSVSVIKRFKKQSRNIKLFCESNSGSSTTRNKLLKLAQGDYIYFLDADDYLVDNCLSFLVETARKNNLDILGFDTLETKGLNSTHLIKNMDEFSLQTFTGKRFIEKNVHFRLEIWWYFIKREFVEKYRMKFNKNEYNGDVMFTLKTLINVERMSYLPLSIHRYVQTENSIMRGGNLSISKNRIDYIQMMVLNVSSLINKLKDDSNSSKELINIIYYRRDIFAFFNIVKMLRYPCSHKYVKEKITSLKKANAYPIKYFNNHKYKSILYGLLLFIINRERFLYFYISLKNILKKS